MATEVGASSVFSAQRKRAFEAIERTYAVTKSENVQQQDKNKKRAPIEEEKGRKGAQAAPVATPKPGLAFKKGLPDEEAHAAYCELSQTVHENLLKPHLQHLGAGTNTVNRVIHDLLQNGDSSQKYMQGSTGMKIDDRLLLDNFVLGRGALQNARMKALQSHSKRSRKHMSMGQHRACGSFDFPQKCSKFEFFKPMHEMWKEYILQLTKESGKRQLGHVLLMADLQGAILHVVECKANAFTGVSGIMIRETAETFGIITLNDKFQVVPKKGSVFQFRVGCRKITLFGDKLSLRNIGP